MWEIKLHSNITAHFSQKQLSQSSANNFGWYTRPRMQFHKKENPHPKVSIFSLGKIKDVVFLFLHHVLGFHFLETIK